MTDALVIREVTGLGTFLHGPFDPQPIAKVLAEPAWAKRLARVPQLEDSLKRILRIPLSGELTEADIAAREVAAKLCASIETCVCGRPVELSERCPCSACPSCCEERCRPHEDTSDCGHCATHQTDPDVEIEDYSAVARERY